VATPSALAKRHVKEADWLPVATRFCVEEGHLDQIQAAALACQYPPLPDYSQCNEDEGDESESLQSVSRRLLNYMRGRKKAEIGDEMCRQVWYRPCEDATPDAIKSALRKANLFLSSRSVKTLSRSDMQINWA
jgi:hypothetical protein